MIESTIIKGGVWERIEACKNDATKTEKKLIDSLKKIDAKALIYMSVTELADVTDASEATIVRFCRSLGFSGFQEFKLKLSREAVQAEEAEDAAVTDKAVYVANQIKSTIDFTRREIKFSYYLEIAQKILDAKRVLIAAVGNSFVAATAFKIKLTGLGIVAEATADTHLQSMMVSNMTSGDIVIVISVSGSTKDILRVAETAKNNSVPVVAVTNYFKSPLTQYSDYFLFNSRKDDPASGGTLVTVISQLYVIDVLCAALRERLGDAEIRTSKITEAVLDKLI